jgi:nucleotide-binding universal stress UspA family protein
MYSNVLVPVDLEHKDQAGTMIRTAASIADDDAKITLLFVMPEMPAVVGLHLPEDSIKKARADAEQQLQELAKINNAPESTSIATAIGRPHHKILDVAERHGMDLIVIASHQPGLADYLLGSVAASVVRHAKCSVHVIR